LASGYFQSDIYFMRLQRAPVNEASHPHLGRDDQPKQLEGRSRSSTVKPTSRFRRYFPNLRT
jgi:hypothetical protein